MSKRMMFKVEFPHEPLWTPSEEEHGDRRKSVAIAAMTEAARQYIETHVEEVEVETND